MNLTIFEVNGDDNAKQLFEFMANPEATKVEWEHIKIGAESSGRNIVGNSHSKDKTGLLPYHFMTGYTIREANHNHPSENPNASPYDDAVAKLVQSAQPNSILNVYTNKHKAYKRYGKYH